MRNNGYFIEIIELPSIFPKWGEIYLLLPVSISTYSAILDREEAIEVMEDNLAVYEDNAVEAAFQV